MLEQVYEDDIIGEMIVMREKASYLNFMHLNLEVIIGVSKSYLS